MPIFQKKNEKCYSNESSEICAKFFLPGMKVQQSAVLWCVVLCCVELCVELCCVVLCCAVLCCAVLCCVVLCCVVLWCGVLYLLLTGLVVVLFYILFVDCNRD